MERVEAMCLPLKPYRIEREWEHAGLKCAVTQNREGGNRCGYVRVPPNHAEFGKDYNSVDVDVHGGLTFGEPEPCAHEDGQGWWYGFDCAHAGDACHDPANPPEWARVEKYGFMREGHYWTQAEVEAEVERLAEQLAVV